MSDGVKPLHRRCRHCQALYFTKKRFCSNLLCRQELLRCTE